MNKMEIPIALIGDYNPKVDAHIAIPCALTFYVADFHVPLTWTWIETSILDLDPRLLKRFAGIWVTPGSPYKNMNGVIAAIQFARETKLPFLGTCGGFQHALIEYARHVSGMIDADHEETNPTNKTLIVKRLACSLDGKSDSIMFTKGSQLNDIFKDQATMESYQCNYGPGVEWKNRLEKDGIQFTGSDKNGEPRAFELPAVHPFFIGALFQPELSALKDKRHPLIKAFIESCSQNLKTNG